MLPQKFSAATTRRRPLLALVAAPQPARATARSRAARGKRRTGAAYMRMRTVLMFEEQAIPTEDRSRGGRVPRWLRARRQATISIAHELAPARARTHHPPRPRRLRRRFDPPPGRPR